MSPLETFDLLCTSFKDTLQSRGATYRQAEIMVTSWIRPTARRSKYRQTPRASKKAVRLHRYQRAQRRKMAAGPSDALSHTQINPPGNTKQMMQTSNSPVQHLGTQRSKNRRNTKNEATQAIGTGPRSCASKPRGYIGETERDKTRDLPSPGKPCTQTGPTATTLPRRLYHAGGTHDSAKLRSCATTSSPWGPIERGVWQGDTAGDLHIGHHASNSLHASGVG
ncbi:Hypothetical predicted protein [Pelobates cultripes]|uniref:Uncharacterized protein n=1 Tax=Pelobates cultripes TaxID=61616 RepID=A0AAD1W2S5_PELCU|nr:Hypothetical predicted protein [Pelobates cultripes]